MSNFYYKLSARILIFIAMIVIFTVILKIIEKENSDPAETEEIIIQQDFEDSTINAKGEYSHDHHDSN